MHPRAFVHTHSISSHDKVDKVLRDRSPCYTLRNIVTARSECSTFPILSVLLRRGRES